MADNQKQKSAAEIAKGDLHVLTLSEAQVEQLLDLNLLLDGLEKGFEALIRIPAPNWGRCSLACGLEEYRILKLRFIKP